MHLVKMTPVQTQSYRWWAVAFNVWHGGASYVRPSWLSTPVNRRIICSSRKANGPAHCLFQRANAVRVAGVCFLLGCVTF